MNAGPESQETSETFQDRRRHSRYRFSVPLTVRCANGAVIAAISMEISESGMSAITAESLQMGDIVELEPIVGSKISARIRHNVGRIYGFEFLNLTAEQAQRITKKCSMLPRYQGNPLGI
jgi:PilZ domain